MSEVHHSRAMWRVLFEEGCAAFGRRANLDAFAQLPDDDIEAIRFEFDRETLEKKAIVRMGFGAEFVIALEPRSDETGVAG